MGGVCVLVCMVEEGGVILKLELFYISGMLIMKKQKIQIHSKSKFSTMLYEKMPDFV